MLKRISLAILITLSLSSVNFAQESVDETAVSDRDQEISKVYSQARQRQTGRTLSPNSAPDSVNPMNVKINYKNGAMSEWSLFSGPQLACRIKYKNRKPVSVEIFDKNGNLKADDYRTLYPSGAPKMIETYKRGIQQTRNGFYENGQLRYRSKKKRDGSIGYFREYDTNGQVRNGPYKETYSGGQAKGIGNFRKGVPSGTFLSFCEDGKVLAEKQFKKGRLVSQTWDKNAHCEDTFSYLEDGVKPVVTIMNRS